MKEGRQERRRKGEKRQQARDKGYKIEEIRNRRGTVRQSVVIRKEEDCRLYFCVFAIRWEADGTARGRRRRLEAEKPGGSDNTAILWAARRGSAERGSPWKRRTRAWNTRREVYIRRGTPRRPDQKDSVRGTVAAIRGREYIKVRLPRYQLEHFPCTRCFRLADSALLLLLSFSKRFFTIDFSSTTIIDRHRWPSLPLRSELVLGIQCRVSSVECVECRVSRARGSSVACRVSHAWLENSARGCWIKRSGKTHS